MNTHISKQISSPSVGDGHQRNSVGAYIIPIIIHYKDSDFSHGMPYLYVKSDDYLKILVFQNPPAVGMSNLIHDFPDPITRRMGFKTNPTPLGGCLDS